MLQLFCKTVWQFLKRLNIKLAYDPLVPFVGIYQREKKTYVQRIVCNTPKWKQSRCPLPCKWINMLYPSRELLSSM